MNAVTAFSVLLFIVNLLGCMGFTYARQKAKSRLDGIIEDADAESSNCRVTCRRAAAVLPCHARTGPPHTRSCTFGA